MSGGTPLGGVGVVTITYSPGRTLDDFVRSLETESFPPREIVVVDNGSVDGAPERVAAAQKHVRLVRSPGNVGYGRAANLGVGQFGPEVSWVLVCNPDTQVTPGAVEALLAAAADHPRAGILGPRILEPDGTVYPSARALPSIRTGVGHAVFSGVWPTNPWTRRYQQRDVSSSSEPTTVGWLSGAFLLLRREAFESIGGFDSDFFMYFEDVDLGRRMTNAGWLNLFVPAAVVVHIGGASTDHVADAMIAAHHRSAYTYIAKTHPGMVWAPIRVAVRLGLAVRARSIVRKSHRALPSSSARH
ncbi:glycosyltransferase family 2 protein [Frondihabitans cladoniiphilus]|uniref:Glycosyltransferase family 2 protein n=1 Tax=Frondihabitans cladoniiphilus TaxID=715785 RepID=A0ABP8WFB4_9MICO